MSVPLLAAALVVATGTIAALATSDARLGLVGLVAALISAALVADPLPVPAVLGVRLTAALLAVVLLRVAVDVSSPRHAEHHQTTDSRASLGWPAEVLLGLAGAAAGLGIAASLASAAPVEVGAAGPIANLGPGVASTAALTLGGLSAALGLPPLLTGPLGPRRASAAVIVTEGAILARVGLAGPPAILEEVVLDALLVAVAAAAAILVAASRSTGRTDAHPA